MKKIIPFILILVVLVALFSPTSKAHAVDGIAGICSLPANGAVAAHTEELEESNCEYKGGTWTANRGSGINGSQAATSPGTPTPPPTPKPNTDTTYTPLAPLPGFLNEDGSVKPFDTDPGCTTDATGKKTCTNPCVFGKYMNIMINLLIGIAGVLAVLMIVIGGLEYMTSELISSKEHGKEKINNAILGLVIALGAWALLNTLNPVLLDVCLDKLPEAKITIMDEGEESYADAVQDDTAVSAPIGPAPLCPEGIQRTRSGMYACGSIAQNLNNMIDAANSAGLRITGGGYRTLEAQRALRIKNCAGNETDRNADCRPPTAIPGASRHNNGLAFDLKCGGSLIRSNENACFKWLKINAKTFGFDNLKSEQWHWSTDGK